LKDRFGLSWQVVPDRLTALLTDRNPEKGRRAMAAVLQMKKIELADVERAAAGAEREMASKR
jgi:predicted 3-demethylubiquinone-9 3-methyltransferase (glyoxalase superfamily)